MDGIAWVDGCIVDAADAKVPLLDRGHLLGDGVFETLRTANGRMVRPDEHLRRLAHGLQVIGLDPGATDAAAEALDALVRAGGERFGDALYLRIQVTAGVQAEVAGVADGLHVTGVARPFQPYPMRHYARGIHAIVAPQRKHRDDPMNGVKSVSFASHLAARRFAMDATAHDALLLNDAGRIAEATTSNVFAVKGDTVHAPGRDEGALDGVTRAMVLELVEDTGLDVAGSLSIDGLAAADEAFLTNTIGGVVPLTRFNDAPIGDGTKGELTTRLGAAYDALVQQ